MGSSPWPGSPTCSSAWSRAEPRPTSSSDCYPGPGRPSGLRLPRMLERRDGRTALALGIIASLLTAILASTAPAAEAGEGRASTRRSTDRAALAKAGGPAPCAADDLDCRAFTGTLAWRPDETWPLLSSTSLRRLTLLRHLPGGQRERALRCLAFIAWAEARSDGVEGM